MYSKEDTVANNAHIKKVLTVLIIAFIITAAALVPTLMLRMEWLTTLVSCLGGAFVIFFWSMKLTPLLWYRKFLRELNNGMSHEMTAEFVSFSPDLATHDGVSAHIMELSEGPKEKGEDLRMFYWDDAKPAPTIQPGEMVHIVSHGNFVVDWNIA